MKLHKKYEIIEGDKSAMFVDCLDNMRNEAGASASFLEYTSEWIDKVNRGGLFVVSDEAYCLFVKIETVMRIPLAESLTTNSDSSKSSIISKVCSNEDVLFYWSIVSTPIRNKEDSME
jgi:hypothetical protein